MQNLKLPQIAVFFADGHFRAIQHAYDLVAETNAEYRYGEVSKHLKVREKIRARVTNQGGITANDDSCRQVS